MPYSVAAMRGTRTHVSTPPWWMAAGVTPLIAYDFKNAPNLATSYINLANPGTLDAVDLGSPPTHTPGVGSIFDGVANFLDTTYAPSGNIKISAFIQFDAFTGGMFSYLFGEYDGGTDILGCYSTDSAITHGYVHGAAGANVASACATGNLGLSYSDGYFDGVLDTAITAALSNSIYPIYIGARNSTGVASLFASVTVIGFWLVDVQINNVQVAALAAAMAAL